MVIGDTLHTSFLQRRLLPDQGFPQQMVNACISVCKCPSHQTEEIVTFKCSHPKAKRQSLAEQK